jgi:hypothetical protein
LGANALLVRKELLMKAVSVGQPPLNICRELPRCHRKNTSRLVVFWPNRTRGMKERVLKSFVELVVRRRHDVPRFVIVIQSGSYGGVVERLMHAEVVGPKEQE